MDLRKIQDEVSLHDQSSSENGPDEDSGENSEIGELYENDDIMFEENLEKVRMLLRGLRRCDFRVTLF